MRLAKLTSAYRITHRLPGRIRIHIPMLERLPSEWSLFLEPSAELIKMLDGISSAEIQPVTGKLLICYDPELTDEARILKWLKRLVADFLNQDVPPRPLEEADIRFRFKQLKNQLRRKNVPSN